MDINEEKKEEDKSMKENESIDDFFEKVQKETNIPNNIKKKLVNAFKKKGILNVKILLLFYEKYVMFVCHNTNETLNYHLLST